jgi:hypothetical protein
MAVLRDRGANAWNISQEIWLSSGGAAAVGERAGEVSVAAGLRLLALGQPPQPSFATIHGRSGRLWTL